MGGRKLLFPITLTISLYNSLYYRTSRDVNDMLLTIVTYASALWVQSKQNLTAKEQVCADSKREYASEVSKMKVVQNEHYVTAMPRIFQVS